MLVVDAYSRSDSQSDLAAFDSDLMLADMEIVSNRITLWQKRSASRCPSRSARPSKHEQATLKAVLAGLEEGKPLREKRHDRRPTPRDALLPPLRRTRVVFFNTADDETKPERLTALATPQTPVVAIPAGLERNLPA